MGSPHRTSDNQQPIGAAEGNILILPEPFNFGILFNYSLSQPQQLYAWVFGLGPDAEIVSPPAAVRGMKKAIEGIAERYNAETGVFTEARKAGGRKAYRKKYGTLPLTNSRDEDECKPKGL